MYQEAPSQAGSSWATGLLWSITGDKREINWGTQLKLPVFNSTGQNGI
jgi:hypothetical protein